MVQAKSINNQVDSSKYRAPALEKGLEILELLSRAICPLTMQNISEQLKRSKAELYRMLHVLENHGYVQRFGDPEGFILTKNY